MATLIAVSHGTSSPAGRAAVAGLVDAVRQRLDGVDVLDAFVDVQAPRLDEVVASASGESVVVPLLLTPGLHVHVDIRRAVAGRPAMVAPVLGPDDAVTDVLVDRLQGSGLREDDSVVLGVAGSSVAQAHRSMEHARQLLSMTLGRPVVVGHLGGTGRPIDGAIEAAAATGRRVVVASYLLAPGHFSQVLRCTAAHVVAAPLLDGGPPDPRLVDLVVERYRTVRTGRLANAS